MSFFGFMPAVLLFIFEGIDLKVRKALEYEPKFYLIFVIVGLLSLFFFTYVVAEEKKFSKWDYLKASFSYSIIAIVILLELMS